MTSSLQLFAYAAAVLWALGFLILGAWAAYLSFKMENCRMPNKSARRGQTFAFQKKFAFQKNGSDYTETDQMYRCKAIKVELALFAWSALLSRPDIASVLVLPKTCAKFHLAPTGKSPLRLRVILSHQEGRLAIATNAGQGAVAAGPVAWRAMGAADGEAVWS